MKPDLWKYFLATDTIPPDRSLEQFKATYFPKKDPAREEDPVSGGFLAYADDDKSDLREITQLIQQDGGFAVLPHPGHWCRGTHGSPEDLETLLEYCASVGVWGVEQYYYIDPAEDINALVREISPRLDLHLTFGTDCHGPGSRQDTLERAWMDLTLDEWNE